MVDVLVAKITFALVFAIILIYFLPVSLAAFGMHTCTSCGFLVRTFVFSLLPVLLVFAGFYKIISVFTG